MFSDSLVVWGFFVILRHSSSPTIYYLSAKPRHHCLSPENFKWHLTLGIKDVETMDLGKKKKSLPDIIHNKGAFAVLSTSQSDDAVSETNAAKLANRG